MIKVFTWMGKYHIKSILSSRFNEINSYKRLFHGTSIIFAGRRTGSKALEPDPRPLSKKQKKRKAEKSRQQEQIRDPAKERLQKSTLKKKIESSEFKSFVEEAQTSLDDVLNNLKLPSSLFNDDVMEQTEDKFANIDAQGTLEQLKKYLKMKKANENLDSESNNNPSQVSHLSSTMLIPDNEIVNEQEKVNLSLQKLLVEKQNELADDMIYLMNRLNIDLDVNSYTLLIKTMTLRKKYESAEKYFSALISKSQPDINAWTAIIECKAAAGKPEEALHLIDTVLKRSLLAPTMDMFNSILRAYVSRIDRDNVEKIWLRMHREQAKFNIESFHIMLKFCSRTSQAERAFFYFDELKACGLEPSIDTFVQLIRASAEAPHWENGFHDIIFDAMSKFEGSELKPTVQLYNAIIHAFGKAGDATASEFYYWEMIRKGIQPNIDTYNALLFAYGRNCSVRAGTYGYKGRYVKPLERKYTKEEQAFADIGPRNTIKYLSRGISHDGPLERGRRQMAPLQDDLDNNNEYSEAVMDEIITDSKQLRMAQNKNKKLNQKPIESKSSNQLDPSNYFTNLESILNDFDAKGNVLSNGKGNQVELTNDEMNLFKQLMSGLSPSETNAISQSLAEEDNELSIGDNDIDLVKNQGNSSHNDSAVRRGRQRKPMPKRSKRGNPEELRKESEMNLSSKSNDINELESLMKMFNDDFDSEDTMKASNTSSSSMNDYDSKDKEFFNKELSESIEEDNDISMNDSPDYSHLFKQKYPVDRLLRKSQQMMRFDEFVDPFIGNIPIASPSSLGNERERDLKRLENNNLFKLLDDPFMNETKGLMRATDQSMSSYNPQDDAWDDIEFGRAPDPDYTISLSLKKRIFTRRGELAFQDCLERGLRPTSYTMNSYLSVYAEALYVDKALNILSNFEQYGVRPDTFTFRILIRMHVRVKNIPEAMRCKDVAIQSGIAVAPETYGLLIECHIHRDMVVEALKLLEEATERKLKIPEYSLRILRARCKTLRVDHPDMPEDPLQWVKDIKEIRRKARNSSNSDIQDIKSIII